MAFTSEPSPRTGHVAATYGSNMIVWGGNMEHGDSMGNIYFSGSELWTYHFVTEAWTCKICVGQCPPGTSGACALIYQGNMYIFGGFRGNSNTNSLYCLNIQNCHWKLLSPSGCTPTAVDKTVGWEHKGKLYFFGGFGPIPKCYPEGVPSFQYTVADTPSMLIRGWTNQFLVYDIKKNRWDWPTFKGTLPIARAAHAAAVVNNKVYVFGGRHNEIRMNDLHCLDLETMTWSGQLNVAGKLPARRSWHSLSTVSDGLILLYGGFGQNNEPLSDCWLIHTKGLLWQRVELPFEKPRLWHSACVSPFDDILIYGGCTGDILDTSIIPEHAKEMVFLRISPKCLLRLCMDAVAKNRDHLEQKLHLLPNFIQNAILSLPCMRSRCSVNIHHLD